MCHCQNKNNVFITMFCTHWPLTRARTLGVKAKPNMNALVHDDVIDINVFPCFSRQSKNINITAILQKTRKKTNIKLLKLKCENRI